MPEKITQAFNPEDAVNAVFLLYLQNELLLVLNSINPPETEDRKEKMDFLVKIISRNMSIRAQELFPIAIQNISDQAKNSGMIIADEKDAKSFKEHFDKFLKNKKG